MFCDINSLEYLYKMLNETLSKCNQSGYFKYKLEYRKGHEGKLCSEEYKGEFKECSFRHPKACKNVSEKCLGWEDCSYRHEKD